MNLTTILTVVLAGLTAVKTNFGRLAMYSVLNKSSGPIDKIEHFIHVTKLLVKTTVIMAIVPFIIGIATGRFGMNVGLAVTIGLAVLTLTSLLTVLIPAARLYLERRNLRKGNGPTQQIQDRIDGISEKLEDGLYLKIGCRFAVLMALITVAVIMGIWNEANQETVARGFLTSAAFFGSVGLGGIFRFRVMIFTEIGRVGSDMAHAVSKKIPVIPQNKTDALFIWFSGYCAWAAAGIGGIAIWFPIWRDLTILTWLFVGIIGMAAMFSAKWSKSEKIRKLTMKLTTVGVAVSLISLLIPGPFAGLRVWTGLAVDDLSAWITPDTKMKKIEKEMKYGKKGKNGFLGEDEIKREIYSSLLVQKRRIEEKLLSQCDGQFTGKCEKDKAQYAELEDLIKTAKKGQYIRKQAGLSDNSVWGTVKSWTNTNVPQLAPPTPATASATASRRTNPATAPPPPPTANSATSTAGGRTARLAPPPPVSGSVQVSSNGKARKGSFGRMLQDLNNQFPDI